MGLGKKVMKYFDEVFDLQSTFCYDLFKHVAAHKFGYEL